MNYEPRKIKWQDWAMIAMHVLSIVGITAAILLWRSANQTVVIYDDLLIMSGVALASLTALIVTVLVSSMRSALPMVVLGVGWVLVAGYLYIVEAQPILIGVVGGSLIIAGVLYLGPSWGSFHATGVIAAVAGLIIYFLGADNLDFGPYAVPLVSLVTLALTSGGWIYSRYRYEDSQKAELNDIAEQRAAHIDEMRERTKVMAEMTHRLSGTLNYEKILEATLDIGHLSVRQNSKQRLVSIVFLFRETDEDLYIANARGLNHIDLQRTVSAKSGIISQALEEGFPIIGKRGWRDPEFSGFHAFQGIRSTLCIPLRAHYDNFGVLYYASTEPNAFNADHIDALHSISLQATVALQNAFLYNSLMEEKARIIQMEEDARKALVRDLHDVPTQTVSAMVMRLRIAQRMLEKTPDEIPSELASIEEMAVRATQELRHVLFKLRPLALESQGISAALDQLSEKMQQTYQQAMVAKVHPDVEQYLDQTQQGALFYLIEEAVNNARKYAEASLISVQAGRQRDTILVRIADNGRGFDVAEVQSGYDGRGSFGMVNMRERAELLDGTLELKSVPGRGTTINVYIPIDYSKIKPDPMQMQMPYTKLAASARATLEKMGRG